MPSDYFPKIGVFMAFFLQNRCFGPIFLCFNAKGSYPKHPKEEGGFPDFFGGRGPLIKPGVGGLTSLIMGVGDIVTSIKS